MFGIKTILLALGSLALSYGEKILSQGSNSGGRQLKAKKKEKKNSPSYVETLGYHDPRNWAVFTNFADDTCQTITGCHGYPEGVCAHYEYDDDVWWMNYAGESKINMNLMYSFYNDELCTLPRESKVASRYGDPYNPQGVYSWGKRCHKEGDGYKTYSAQDEPPSFYNGVVFNIFANETHCKANSIQATLEFNFVPYGQCGPMPFFSTFLRGQVTPSAPGQVDLGIELRECNELYVDLDVHADMKCETDHTTVRFFREETCKDGQNCGDVIGFGNFKCV